MHAVSHGLLFALGAMVALPGVVYAQTADLPPIFAEPRPRVTSSTKPHVAPLPLSSRARELVFSAAQQMLANAQAFEIPTPTGRMTEIGVGRDATVLMEEFVVKAPPLHIIELPPPETSLLRFIKTGTFYRNLQNGMETEIYFRVLTVAEPRGLNKDHEFTRVQVAFSYSW